MIYNLTFSAVSFYFRMVAERLSSVVLLRAQRHLQEQQRLLAHYHLPALRPEQHRGQADLQQPGATLQHYVTHTTTMRSTKERTRRRRQKSLKEKCLLQKNVYVSARL